METVKWADEMICSLGAGKELETSTGREQLIKPSILPKVPSNPYLKLIWFLQVFEGISADQYDNLLQYRISLTEKQNKLQINHFY